MMSPIPEMDSSKGSISKSATGKSRIQDDERKLTGTGAYNLHKYKLDDVEEDEDYSDDFESVSNFNSYSFNFSRRKTKKIPKSAQEEPQAL